MGKDIKRLQFDFTTDAVNELDTLKDMVKAPSRAELVRRALRFYEYAVSMSNKGYKVELTRGDDKQTLEPISVI